MCEFLVYAKKHWMELEPQEAKDKWNLATWKKYNRRSIKGNPIVVKPDGCKWGKDERPPSYVIIKVLGMSVKEGEAYLAKAFDTSVSPDIYGRYPLKYRKKYKYNTTDIDTALVSKEPIATTKTILETKMEERI